MVSSFEQWYGKTVVLRLITGETRVPLRGIIVAESGDAVRFRIAGGWDIDVYKALILDVEREKGRLNIQASASSPLTTPGGSRCTASETGVSAGN